MVKLHRIFLILNEYAFIRDSFRRFFRLYLAVFEKIQVQPYPAYYCRPQENIASSPPTSVTANSRML